MKTKIDTAKTEEMPFGPAKNANGPTAGGVALTMILAVYPMVAAIMAVMAGLATAAPN